MKYLLLLLVSTSIFAATSAETTYLQALKYEEVDADFMKAKQLYSKIIAENVTEQEYIARSMYHIALISEMYNQKVAAKNYYNMIIKQYSKFKGLKFLATNGLARLSKNKVSCTPGTETKATVKARPNTAVTTKVAVKKGPFDNDKYKKGKTAPLYVLNIGDKIEVAFDGIKGVGASTQSVADIKPTTSKLEVTAKKVGFVEIMIKDNNGKENYINVNVVDAVNNKITDLFLIKGESKKIHITDLEKIAVDNDNVELKHEDGIISIKAKKEGNITLNLMKKGGTKVDVSIKVLKPYEKKMTLSLKQLQTKEIKFDNISSISVTSHGIVDVKQETKTIKVTGTSKGKTFVIVYGKDGSQLKLDIEVN